MDSGGRSLFLLCCHLGSGSRIGETRSACLLRRGWEQRHSCGPLSSTLHCVTRAHPQLIRQAQIALVRSHVRKFKRCTTSFSAPDCR